MTFTLDFTLPPAGPVPAAYAPVAPHLSRHHILGRKYLQVIYALAERTRVAPGTIERFAGRPTNHSSAWNGVLPGAFYWSPFDLFVGPVGTLRVFDPSSGVEQQRPNSFPQPRWDALKELPAFLEELGIPLERLVVLESGRPVKWPLKSDSEQIRTQLTKLIKAVTETCHADQVHVHGLNPADWAWIKVTDTHNFRPQHADDVASIYERFKGVLVPDSEMSFDNALNEQTGAFLFLLKPPPT